MKEPSLEEKVKALASTVETVLQSLEQMVQRPMSPEQTIYYHAMIVANKVFRAQLYSLLGDYSYLDALLERNKELMLQTLQGGNA